MTEPTGATRLPVALSNCPINERSADGQPLGRCWFFLPDGKTCPRHGDVTQAVETYKKTGRLTPEELR